MKIYNFEKFLEISGMELVGPIGPAYGETSIKNKTITTTDNFVIYSNIDQRFYTFDDYNIIYNEYLKRGGEPLYGFKKENINKILIFLDNLE